MDLSRGHIFEQVNWDPNAWPLAKVDQLTRSIVFCEHTTNKLGLGNAEGGVHRPAAPSTGAKRSNVVAQYIRDRLLGGFGNACVAIRLAILEPRKAVRLTTTVTYAIYAGRVSIRHNRRPRARHPPRSNTPPHDSSSHHAFTMTHEQESYRSNHRSMRSVEFPCSGRI